MSTQLRPLTIPRLELQAAVLATRLYRSIAEESQLQFENVTFFSDSNILLSWIRSKAREFKPFVSARVAEIQSNSDPSQWNTCRESKMWLMKSLGTYQRNDRWQMETGTRILTTVRGVASRSFYCWQKWGKVQVVMFTHSPEVIDCKTFSSWRKLVRASSYVLRFIWNLQAQCRTKERTENSELVQFSNGPLAPQELEEAEKNWVKEGNWWQDKKQKAVANCVWMLVVKIEGIERIY